MRLKMLGTFFVVVFVCSAVSFAASPKTGVNHDSTLVNSAIEKLKGETTDHLTVYWPSNLKAPEWVMGILSSPDTRSPSEIAISFLDNHRNLFLIERMANLKLSKIVPTRIGAVVKFRQEYEGIPIVGAGMAVRVDAQGRVRQVTNSYLPLSGVNTAPLVSVEDARTVVLDTHALVPVQVPEDIAARLVLLALPSNGVALAWELHTGACPQLLSNWVFYVDAETGTILLKQNRVWFDRQAYVFEQNPVSTPEEKIVTLEVPDDYVHPAPDGGIRTVCDPDVLPKLEDGGPWSCDCKPGDCLWLSDPEFSSLNCPDLHETVEFTMIPGVDKLHMCSMVQTTSGDTNNDFLYSPRLSDGGLDDTNPNDKFTEVQMYYHVTKIYAFYYNLSDIAKGTSHPVSGSEWKGMAAIPLLGTVNFQLPFPMTGGIPSDFTEAMDPNGKLYPMDNAMFMPGGPGGIPGLSSDKDQMVFGQGTFCDFSWDGDVIYHEFTHGVANSIADALNSMWSLDDWGSIAAPIAMNEGMADFFAGVLTDEPRMGEYSLAAMGQSYMRDLRNTNQCPWYLNGESHNDGTAWAGALWNGLNAIAAGDRDTELKVAALMMAAESTLPANVTFDSAAEVFLGVIEEEMGADARAKMLKGFDDHKIYKCERYYDLDNLEGKTIPSIAVPAPADVGLSNWGPAMAQFKKTIHAPGVKSIKVDISMAAASTMGFGTTGDPEPLVIFKPGDERIKITYEGKNAASDGQGDPIAMEVNSAKPKYTLTWTPDGGIPGGSLWFMFVNKGTIQGASGAPNVKLGDPLPTPEDAGAGDAGQDAGLGDGGGDGGAKEEGGGGSCGCSTVGSVGSASMIEEVLGALVSLL